MKKVILLFFLSITCFSQNVRITYNYKILEDDVMLKNDILKEGFLNKIKAAHKLKFNLDFNDSIAKFKLQETLSEDGLDIDGAISASNCRKEKFIFKNKTYQNNSEGLFKENEFLIIDSLENKWKLTNEKIIIDGYECYKATTEYVVKNSYGEFHHPVIAWYCPEIPFQYGPAGYGGLPGLILQLQVRHNLFGAEKININFDSNEFLELPKKGKVITYFEYNKKISEIMENRFKNKE
ncbi:GLPGLI family protein [uncultured Flavobacterium sp.]|uniref:GLPGLI family protein n=1 Tax=uncultured Flavobacterium sp. TaxID=165435 RepID=UPI0030C8A1FB